VLQDEEEEIKLEINVLKKVSLFNHLMMLELGRLIGMAFDLKTLLPQ